MKGYVCFLSACFCLAMLNSVCAEDVPGLTTLGNPDIRYERPEKPYVVLKRGDVEAVIVDNRAVSDDILPNHHAGYSGVAKLSHTARSENLFVPYHAGLNLEFIYDGSQQETETLFEPRRAPMQLRVVDQYTVELYQAPTPHYGLESCQRYELLEDGAIQLTLECIPRQESFAKGYLGLFWASYIHQPESLDIHFRGHAADESVKATRWVRGVTPQHGVLPTHLATYDDRLFDHAPKFPVRLIFNRSKHRYTEPWYFGISHGMAYVLMFRPQDGIRLTQSPSGGGQGNPAWDFQYFLENCKVGRRYQMVMRALYTPFESAEQIQHVSARHRKALTDANSDR